MRTWRNARSSPACPGRGGTRPRHGRSRTWSSSRSAPASRATCTTSSPTRSPSSSRRPTAPATRGTTIRMRSTRRSTTIASHRAQRPRATSGVLLAELRHAEPEGPQPTLADLDRPVDAAARLRTGRAGRTRTGALESARLRPADRRLPHRAGGAHERAPARRHQPAGHRRARRVDGQDGGAAITITVRNSMQDTTQRTGLDRSASPHRPRTARDARARRPSPAAR